MSVSKIIKNPTGKDRFKNPIYSKVMIAEQERKKRSYKVVVRNGQVVIIDNQEEEKDNYNGL